MSNANPQHGAGSSSAPPETGWRIGVDIGGTFTDLVAVDETGHVTFAKTATTPADQSVGVMEGLARLAGALGLAPASLLARTERIVHGMTVATNTLLERKGAKVGLLTTEGHRDVLEMREGLKPERYNLRLPRQPALVPRHLRLGVRERIRADGRVEAALDRDSLAAAIAALQRARVEAVAICYLHAWRNPAHEQATREAVRAAMPDAYISQSAEVLPQIKEYERVSTTVANAYVGPAISRYLSRLEARLREGGYRGPTLILLSHGGVAPVAEAIRIAAGSVLSGPAGGLAGARHAAGMLAARDLISFDMGGTSTDIALVVDGEAALSADREVGGQRIGLPSLDIVTLGAGGGSIARTDRGGLLQVGPESAGAVPGPACYGSGGTEVTVTDANVVLGYLDPENFLGGRERLDMEAAGAALDRLGAGLGVDRLRAAAGVHRVVNTQLAEGIRLATVRRGVDPRRFALFGFGGAAGLHVTELARMLEITRVVVPRVASVLSAWGMLATDLRHEVARTHIGDMRQLDADALRALYRELEDDGTARLRESFSGEIAVQRAADMRYGEQIFEIDVPLDGVDWTAPDLLDQVAERFHRRHEALYTYALRDREPVLVNARVAVIGRLPATPAEPVVAVRAEAPPAATRRAWFEGWQTVPVYNLDDLAPEQQIDGPAIIESATTTIVLRRGDAARATPQLWLDVAVAGAGGAA